MVGRKEAGVRNEALRLGPVAIQAEAPNLQHANPPNSRSNVFVGVTPRLKRGSIQVRVFALWCGGSPCEGAFAGSRPKTDLRLTDFAERDCPEFQRCIEKCVLKNF